MTRTRARFKSCIISAPFSAKLSTVKAALEKHGVSWTWAESQLTSPYLPPGELRGIVQGVDIVILVLSDESPTNQFLVAGIAVGLSKPMILIDTRSSRAFDFTLDSIPTIVASVEDYQVVESQLGLYLLSLNPPYWKRTPASPAPMGKSQSADVLRVEDFHSAFEFEMIALFREFSDHVESSPRIRSSAEWQPDALAWIRGLDREVALPVAVEVKASNSDAAVYSGAAALQEYMTENGLPYGIVVLKGKRELSCLVMSGSFVFIIGSEEVESLARGGALVRRLVEYRNRVMHMGS